MRLHDGWGKGIEIEISGFIYIYIYLSGVIVRLINIIDRLNLSVETRDDFVFIIAH